MESGGNNSMVRYEAVNSFYYEKYYARVGEGLLDLTEGVDKIIEVEIEPDLARAVDHCKVAEPTGKDFPPNLSTKYTTKLFEDDSFAKLQSIRSGAQEVFSELGLKLKLVLQKNEWTLNADEQVFVPTIELADQKLIEWLKSLPLGNKESDCENAIRQLGHRLYDQVCRVYDLEVTEDDNLMFQLSSIPKVAAELERLGLLKEDKNLKECADAITGGYLTVYKLLENNSLLPQNFILSSNLEEEFEKIKRVFIEVNKNPKAEKFISKVSAQLKGLVIEEITKIEAENKLTDASRKKQLEKIAKFLDDIVL